MFHPTSTCRIGAADDPSAVADPECRVYGIEGLRVADASVMPCIVSANTNMPAIMIGERVAEFISSASS
jgi:choline dehydrogenase-like flavoprotein